MAWMFAIALGCGDDGEPATSESTGDVASTGTSTSVTVTGASTSSTSSTSEGTREGTSTGEDTGTSTGVGSSEASSSVSTGTTGTTGTSTGEGTTGLGDCVPLLVEVFYDAEGGDDMLQWVELYNPCAEAIDLSTWAIGYGGADYGPPRVKGLTGTVDPGECFVVGGPTADATNGQPIYQYADDFAPGLDIAQAAGGGVALFDVPDDEVDATSVPVDAVVYGANNDNGLIDATGRAVAEPHVGNPAPGGSIQRTSEDAEWIAAETPLPNDCPPF